MFSKSLMTWKSEHRWNPCLPVCVCLSVCVYFPHKRFLGNYHTHHHQTWHGNCLRHDNASHVNYIDLSLHSRSQINILRKKDPRWKELVMWSIWDFLPHHIAIYILQKSSYFCSYVIEMSLRDNLVLCLWKMLKQLRHILIPYRWPAWLNNCVGYYNHRYFFLFCFYTWFGTMYVTFAGHDVFKQHFFGRQARKSFLFLKS